jgi:hypothetical protein
MFFETTPSSVITSACGIKREIYMFLVAKNMPGAMRKSRVWFERGHVDAASIMVSQRLV